MQSHTAIISKAQPAKTWRLGVVVSNVYTIIVAIETTKTGSKIFFNLFHLIKEATMWLAASLLTLKSTLLKPKPILMNGPSAGRHES
jgi:hypothetical protein